MPFSSQARAVVLRLNKALISRISLTGKKNIARSIFPPPLSLDIGLSVGLGHVVFDLPVRGSLLLLYLSGMLCVLCGIGIGTIIATFTRSQQQAQLLGFFVTPPLSMLSGATTPLEAPNWLQPITLLNPVRHFATLARGVMLKGVGIEVVYPNLLTLLVFTIILMGLSTWRFRKQLN